MLRTFDNLEVGSDLLFGFQAEVVVLSLIDGERNFLSKSKSKSQPASLISGQPIEQASTPGVFGLPLLPCLGGGSSQSASWQIYLNSRSQVCLSAGITVAFRLSR